jgi:hypothetical protein
MVKVRYRGNYFFLEIVSVNTILYTVSMAVQVNLSFVLFNVFVIILDFINQIVKRYKQYNDSKKLIGFKYKTEVIP